ncbi:MAG: ATP-binding cassette domain-containing protein [Candidatus Cloacimonadota bacterium]|nr:ATP-binding cassette domain-containing protein [Candidatus Cloacimonadota bacterium]
MIELQNLTKDYGSLRAVDHIDFSIKEGEILGFLGPNGAGKSTTLKMITCYLAPTEGNIQIDNLNVHNDSKAIRELIGYLPEHNSLYTEMSVYDYLKFVAEIRGITGEKFKQVFKNTIKTCGLQGVVTKTINTLSKGYKQRVGIANAIIHDPKIIVLDEPTNGLDPNQILEIRQLIKDLGKEKTLIISSHILQEVQAVCDRIVIINEGKIVGNGTTEELQATFKGKSELKLKLKAEPESIFKMVESVEDISLKIEPREDFIEVTVEYSKDVEKREEIYSYIKSQDWILLEMVKRDVSLEDVFRNLTIEGGNND